MGPVYVPSMTSYNVDSLFSNMQHPNLSYTGQQSGRFRAPSAEPAGPGHAVHGKPGNLGLVPHTPCYDPLHAGWLRAGAVCDARVSLCVLVGNSFSMIVNRGRDLIFLP